MLRSELAAGEPGRAGERAAHGGGREKPRSGREKGQSGQEALPSGPSGPGLPEGPRGAGRAREGSEAPEPGGVPRLSAARLGWAGLGWPPRRHSPAGRLQRGAPGARLPLPTGAGAPSRAGGPPPGALFPLRPPPRCPRRFPSFPSRPRLPPRPAPGGSRAGWAGLGWAGRCGPAPPPVARCALPAPRIATCGANKAAPAPERGSAFGAAPHTHGGAQNPGSARLGPGLHLRRASPGRAPLPLRQRR